MGMRVTNRRRGDEGNDISYHATIASSNRNIIGNSSTEIRDCVGNMDDNIWFYVREIPFGETAYVNVYKDSIAINVAAFDTLEYTFHY